MSHFVCLMWYGFHLFSSSDYISFRLSCHGSDLWYGAMVGAESTLLTVRVFVTALSDLQAFVHTLSSTVLQELEQQSHAHLSQQDVATDPKPSHQQGLPVTATGSSTAAVAPRKVPS